MTEPTSGTASARSGSRKLIEDMLQERQQMLVLMWELSKLELSHVDQTVLETLEEFQDILVDYIAAGHFGLYQRIAEGQERRQPVLALAREMYQRIARSTDVAIEFTEKYAEPARAATSAQFAADLSRLAEEITTRIELEDQLILAMLGHDYVIPASAPGRG